MMRHWELQSKMLKRHYMSANEKKLDTLQQLMIITMEECGELIQRCSKCLRKDIYYDDKKLIQTAKDYFESRDGVRYNDRDVVDEFVNEHHTQKDKHPHYPEMLY